MRIRGAWIAAIWACVALLAAPWVAPTAADGTEVPASIKLGPGSTLWLQGKSNMHDFESRTTTVSVTFTRDANTAAPSTADELATFLRASGVRSLDVEVPVKSLRSSKAGLDKNLWQDLRADQHPAITFHLTGYTVTSLESNSDTIAIKADGLLTVAGHERPITLTSRAYRSEEGLWLEGSEKLLMTEFGIKPRTMMLGTLRVKDPIVVRYRLLLVPGNK